MIDWLLASRFFDWLFGDMHGRDERQLPKATASLCAASALALLGACGGGGGGSAPLGAGALVAMAPVAAQQAPAPRDCSIRFEGDSILNGANGQSQRMSDPPAAILKRLRPAYTIDDRSTPGESAARRMPALINEQISSRFVVVQFGINDAGAGTAYEPAMRAILERVKALGRTPIVTGISRTNPDAPPLANRDAYDAIARRLATEYGVPFANWDAVDLPAALMVDGVHPNVEGTQRLVLALVAALDAVAPECKS